jgi:DNA-binding response OmpR family regulator
MERGSIILVVQGTRRNSLKKTLEKHGYSVLRAVNGKQAVARAKEANPPLAVIDPSSLRINGARLSQMLRRAVDSIHILWVLDEGAILSEDGVADLTLERPITTRKLLNRVRKLMPKPATHILCAGNFTFDVENREVSKEGRKQRVTPKQAKLLEALMRNPSQVLSRRYLMKHVWNTDYLGDTRTLDVHIRWVREAIEDNPSAPRYLHTVRGVGYRFELPESDSSNAQD